MYFLIRLSTKSVSSSSTKTAALLGGRPLGRISEKDWLRAAEVDVPKGEVPKGGRRDEVDDVMGLRGSGIVMGIMSLLELHQKQRKIN